MLELRESRRERARPENCSLFSLDHRGWGVRTSVRPSSSIRIFRHGSAVPDESLNSSFTPSDTNAFRITKATLPFLSESLLVAPRPIYMMILYCSIYFHNGNVHISISRGSLRCKFKYTDKKLTARH